MTIRSEASSAAAGGDCVSVATRAAALSDSELQVIFRLLGGGDPGEKSREQLVEWLSSRQDAEATGTAIELVSKGFRSEDNKRRPETPYAALRIEKRRKLMPLEGVSITFDGATVEKRIDDDDPLSGELMLVVGDAGTTVGDVAAATGLSVRHLADINRELHGDLDRFSELQPNDAVLLESDLESDGESTAGAGRASAQASGVPPAARGRWGLGVGFRGGARRNAPSRKGRAAGSARGALGTSLRDAKGVINPVSLFFGEKRRRASERVVSARAGASEG